MSGESEIDAWFERSGYRVFHPEQHTIREQLAVYASAEKLVFSEGSAIHGVQLLGRNLGHVIVISRRPGRSLGFSLLNPRAQKISHIDGLRGLIAARGEHHAVHGFAVVDAQVLADKLYCEVGIDLRSEIDLPTFRDAQRRDFHAWNSLWGHTMLSSDQKAFGEIIERILRLQPAGMFHELVRIMIWKFLEPARRLLKRLRGSIC